MKCFECASYNGDYECVTLGQLKENCMFYIKNSCTKCLHFKYCYNALKTSPQYCMEFEVDAAYIEGVKNNG